MGAHNDTTNDYLSFSNGTQTIVDPGSNGTFNLNGRDRGVATIASGTRKLPDGVPLGVTVYVYATGSVTITNVAGTTVATLASGEIAACTAITSTTWAAVISTAGAIEINTAADVPVADSSARTTQTTVEGWLNELAGNQRFIEVDISHGILAAGTPLAAFADNAAPNPGITLANSKAVGVRWNNNATQNAPVWYAVPMPYSGWDTSGGFAPTINVLASKVGATVGDATTFTLTAFSQVVGALHDNDSDLVTGATTAMTGNATSKTVQQVTTSLSDLSGGTLPKSLSLSITPTSGTLGTDDVIVHRIWMTY